MQTSKASSRLGSTFLRAAAIFLAIAILFIGFRDVDIGRAFDLVRGIGAAIAVVALPYLFAIALDTLGWRRILRQLGDQLPFGSLFAIRLATEAVQMSVFAGAVVSETIRPWLLERRHGVSWPKSLASLAARKRYIVFGNALYLAIGLVLGALILDRLSVPLLGVSGLPWLVFGFTVVLFATSWGIGAVFGRGAVGARVQGVLASIPWPALRRWVTQKEAGFRQTDHELERCVLGGPRSERAITTALFLASWLLESVETFVILWLLGVEPGFAAVLVMEMVLSLLRSIFFVLPAGLGVQDIGYVAFLGALGVPEAAAVGAAFVILKRGKELFWIAVGYVALFALGGRPANLEEAAQVG
jgi:glycosyltransferase 2 family protein